MSSVGREGGRRNPTTKVRPRVATQTPTSCDRCSFQTSFRCENDCRRRTGSRSRPAPGRGGYAGQGAALPGVTSRFWAGPSGRPTGAHRCRRGSLRHGRCACVGRVDGDRACGHPPLRPQHFFGPLRPRPLRPSPISRTLSRGDRLGSSALECDHASSGFWSRGAPAVQRNCPGDLR